MNIKHIEQKITQLENKLLIEKIKQRKQVTKLKIELGGLVVKAGLSELPKNVILGLLLDAKSKINDSEKILDYYKSLGNIEFSKQ